MMIRLQVYLYFATFAYYRILFKSVSKHNVLYFSIIISLFLIMCDVIDVVHINNTLLYRYYYRHWKWLCQSCLDKASVLKYVF